LDKIRAYCGMRPTLALQTSSRLYTHGRTHTRLCTVAFRRISILFNGFPEGLINVRLNFSAASKQQSSGLDASRPRVRNRPSLGS